MCSSALQYRVLQRVAACCSVLQRVDAYYVDYKCFGLYSFREREREREKESVRERARARESARVRESERARDWD